jgi:hypothetical protein
MPGIFLCPRCRAVDSTQLFDPECDLSSLQPQACDLCFLLFRALDVVGIVPPRVITLRQKGAIVGVENGPDLLSIYVEPGMWTPCVEHGQVALTNIAYNQAQISQKEHNSAFPGSWNKAVRNSSRY